MPAALGLIAFLGGLLVVAACLYYPREIGQEAEPIVDVAKLDIPPLAGLLGKLRQERRRTAAPMSPTTPVEPPAPAQPSADATTPPPPAA